MLFGHPLAPRPWQGHGEARGRLPLLLTVRCLGFSFQYGMVFDAGSSHTSLFVYEWDSDKENDTGVVSQTLSCDVQGQYPSAMGSVLPACSCGGWDDLASLLLSCPRWAALSIGRAACRQGGP